jgi:hypothetical protein
MSRYIVIGIGCLECNRGDGAQPNVELVTDSIEAATQYLTAHNKYSSEWDRQVLDTTSLAFGRMGGRSDLVWTENCNPEDY